MILLDLSAKEVSKSVFCEAISVAHEAIQPILAAQRELQQKIGRPKRDLNIGKSHMVSLKEKEEEEEVGRGRE